MPPGATSVISSARASGDTPRTATTTVDDNRCLMGGHASPGTDARPERYRLFIAIALAEPVKDAILDVQEELRGRLRAKSIRWTSRDQLHLTLRFLGGVDVPRI